MDDDEAPAKAQKQIRNAFNEPIKKVRKERFGPGTTHMPDFVKMTSVGRSGSAQDSLNKPFDGDFLKDPFKESMFPRTPGMDQYLDRKINQNTKMTKEIEATLSKLGDSIGISRAEILTEDVGDSSEILDIDFGLDNDGEAGENE